MIPKIHELLHPKGFFAALWPYRLSSMAFGHCNAASIKLRAIYTIVIVTAALLLAYFTCCDSYKFSTSYESSSVQAITAYFEFWFRFVIIPIHALTWFFVGHTCYMEVVASLTFVDRELVQLCNRHVNLKMMVVRQLVCMTLLLSLTTTIVVGRICVQLNSINWWRGLQIFAIYYSLTVTNVVMSVFGNLVRFIGDRYALVNSALKEIGSSVRKESKYLTGVAFDEATLARQLRVIHRKLFFLSRKVMKAFAIQAFASVLASFILTLDESYLLYRFVASACGKSNIRQILIATIKIVDIFGVVIYMASCCHQTVREANGTTKILNALITSSEELRLEVSSFSYQLMHYQLHFSPLGFFHLDLSLVQNLIGSMATYLVILVQLESMSFSCVTIATSSAIHGNQSAGYSSL